MKSVHFTPLVAQVTPTKTAKKETATPDASKEQVNRRSWSITSHIKHVKWWLDHGTTTVGLFIMVFIFLFGFLKYPFLYHAYFDLQSCISELWVSWEMIIWLADYILIIYITYISYILYTGVISGVSVCRFLAGIHFGSFLFSTFYF